jgi:starch synthase
MSKLRLLFVSSEVVPFAKTGGLADVAGALPIALEHAGLEVKVAMPKYKTVKEKKDTALIGKNTEVLLIKNDKFFGREGLYGDSKGDYPDNLDRFVFFCKETLRRIESTGFKPDIIHCNDWQSALIPVYLKTIYKNDDFLKDARTVFSIHNLAYQGAFPKEEFEKTSLDKKHFGINGLEFYGKVNLMKGGLLFADVLNAVSPTYAKEIQMQEYGCGLDGVLRQRRADLYGVLNGIDYDVWDPAKDKAIFENYSHSSIEKKYVNKVKLQRETGLKQDKDAPLIGIISRLADQKGFDLIAEILDDILKAGAQIIVLGTGEEKYHVLLKNLAEKYPESTSINLRFDAVLACKIYAGCDMFLMPSRYEPCGLGQLISFKYGTVPIVRETGGLKDTVSQFDKKTQKGNGFVFKKYDSKEFLSAIKKALGVYSDKKVWTRLMKKIMKYDFSWDESANHYVDLYKKAAAK